jgi:hypothetical protein
MPMNRNLTWGDRQAEAAREKNLEKLRKLAASAPSAIAEQSSVESGKASTPKKEAKAAKPAAKSSPAKSAAKSSAPAKKKSGKK